MTYPASVLLIAKAICKSGKFETGEGTCSMLCMDQLGDARSNCAHVIAVHGDLATQINSAIDPMTMLRSSYFGPTGPTGSLSRRYPPDYEDAATGSTYEPPELVGMDEYARRAEVEASIRYDLDSRPIIPFWAIALLVFIALTAIYIIGRTITGG